MKSKEEIAKIVCGEDYSLDMLREKGFMSYAICVFFR